MGFIELNEVGYTFPGGRSLFEQVSFKVADGQRVALTGANGVGKTTLLRLIAEPDGDRRGTVRAIGRLARMPQMLHDPRSAATVREMLLAQAPVALARAGRALLLAERRMAAEPSEASGSSYADAVHRWGELGGYDLEVTWNTASIAAMEEPFEAIGDRLANTLSGGELKRVLLEALLRSDADVLLLDEPDNFLDVRGKEWLEQTMTGSRKTILYVSHDREFLANTSTQVVTLEARGAWTHPASFTTYEEARRRRIAGLEEDHRRYQEQRAALIATLKEYQRRAQQSDVWGPKVRAAETRLRMFEEKTELVERPPEQNVTIRLGGGRTGTIALRLTRLEIPGLVQPFSTEILFGQRVGVIGKNGTGKSHFARMLGGLPVDHTGEWMLGARVKVGYFSQVHDSPHLARAAPLTILTREGLDRTAAMGTLRRYELDGAADVPFEKLSGGQQARLQILVLEVRGSTMLVLDEPTDNLDVASADALEYALWNYEGTIIAVTHDRWLLKSFQRFLVFGSDGSVSERDEPTWT
ncbi:MAG: ATP-binding cassette domain-containing protein [Candidatus Dormibacteraeota bacterium]|nr:ATP-binding cassette domain-containing protein [Candidatus Dormibacteraeota bacterium]